MKHENNLRLKEALLNTKSSKKTREIITKEAWPDLKYKSAYTRMTKILNDKAPAHPNLIRLFVKHCNVSYDFIFSKLIFDEE